MRRALLPLLTAPLLLAPGVSRAATCSFRLDVLDVGQGDAVFIQTPDCKTALIDGGDVGGGTVIFDHLDSLGVTTLDIVVVSHMHQDHLAGIVEISEGTSPITVTSVYDRGGTYSSATYTDFAAAYAGKRNTPTVGDVISLGTSVSFTVMGVNTSTVDENARSVVLKMTYGDLDVLLGGDMEATVEAKLAPSIGPVEIYKADHHGSSTSSTNTLLALVQPDTSLVSVGLYNSYSHPAAATVDRLSDWGDVYQTADPATGARDGVITVTSDGSTYDIEQAGYSYGPYATTEASTGQVQSPASVSVTRGTTKSGISTAKADDASRWTLAAGLSGTTYKADWTYSYTLPSTTPGSLTVAWNAKNSVSSLMTVSAYNTSSGAWDKLGSSTFSTKEDTRTWSVSDPTDYVTSAGTVKIRFAGPSSSRTYTSYTDAAWLVWEP